MMGNGFGFGFGIPGLGMLLLWIAIILGLLWLVRSLAGAGDRRDSEAREILDRRFARGEIDREEYLRRKRDID